MCCALRHAVPVLTNRLANAILGGMSDTQPTPLLKVLRSMSVPEQHQLAEQAGTSRNYLYQLAGCTRVPGVALATRIVQAVAEWNKATKGRVPAISMAEIASMCSTR